MGESGGIASLTAERNLPVKIVRRVVMVLVIAFALFYIIARPQDAANAVQVAVGAVFAAGTAVMNFFTALAGS